MRTSTHTWQEEVQLKQHYAYTSKLSTIHNSCLIRQQTNSDFITVTISTLTLRTLIKNKTLKNGLKDIFKGSYEFNDAIIFPLVIYL